MADPTEEEISAFQRWKEKHSDPLLTLARKKDLREFKEKFNVDTGSIFHCPWCFSGRLYERETRTEEFPVFVCRDCELQFQLICLQQDELDRMVARKRQERKEKREALKKGNKEVELISTLTVEALHFKIITCRGCGQKIPPDTEYCTCGWTNPLVGLGDAYEGEE